MRPPWPYGTEELSMPIRRMDNEDVYRLCYVRGPEGIVVGLAEQLADDPARGD